MPRVFVIQENPTHDISPALKHGKVIVLLPPGDNNFSTEWVIQKLKDGLFDFEPDDFLLLTGDPTAIAMAALVATTHLGCGDYLKVLKWNRQTRTYLPLSIPYPGS